MTLPGDRADRPLPDPIFARTGEDEVSDELQFHLDMRVRELVARGVAPDVARRVARERFADFERVAEECSHLAQQREHAVQRARYFTNLGQDVHFSLRMLRRRPAFAALAVLTIGLGIGAATAMYSVVDGVMLRPLPFDDPGRLVAIWAVDADERFDPVLAKSWDKGVLGHADYDALRGARSVRDVALWADGAQFLKDETGTSPITTLRVTSSIFPLLRIRPALGRAFLPGDDVLDGPKVAMLSWEAWHARFGGDPTVLGRGITLNDTRYTIVGILPPGLEINRASSPPPIWIPALQDSSDIAANQNRSYRGVARLTPGTTVRQATAEASRLLHDTAYRPHPGSAARVEHWQVDQTRDVRASLMILLAAVGLLMLIACVNVATLLLGEAARRQPEIASRAALGAGPLRLARQLVTESLVIALLGGVVGWALAWVGIRAMVAFAPPRIPGMADVRLDSRVLAFTTLCALATGIAFGLAPAFALLRRGPRATVRIGGGQTAKGTVVMQRTLIAMEVALSLVLLVGCALLGHSLERLTRVDPGFDPRDLSVVRVSIRSLSADDQRVNAFYAAALRELAALPGVTAVSGSSSFPFSGGGSSSRTKTDSRVYGPNDPGEQTQQREVLAGFFTTLRIPLLAGRLFDESDRAGSEPVAIVSETAARRDWPDQSPIGRRLFWQQHWRTVVGVVGDVKFTQLSHDAEPTLYVPNAQRASPGVMLVVRGTADTRSLANSIRQRIRAVDPAAVVVSIERVTSLIQRSYGEERYRALLASLFGVLAAVLAAVGIFGVISRTVARRIREAGIRAALGASARNLRNLMLRETVIGAGIGLLVGVPIAALTARLLAPYLFGVGPFDPLAFGGALALLAGVSLLATVPPARFAARVDPVTVLRAE